MNDPEEFDDFDNTLNITIDVDDNFHEDEEENNNNNKKNKTKINEQRVIGYTKSVNLYLDLNKAFNWYKENYIGKFDLENNKPPEITINGDYTTTDTNNNNYQEIDNYVPPALTKSIEPNAKKSRSLYSNYFKVNVPPPTISSPITSNGYYKFDGNILIPGTDQDYNIYINIESIPKLTLDNIKTYNYYEASNKYFTVLNKKVYKINGNDSSITLSATPVQISTDTQYVICLVFVKMFKNTYLIETVFNYTSTTTLTDLSKGSYIVQLTTSRSVPATNTVNSLAKTIAIEDLEDSSIWYIANYEVAASKSSDMTIYADLSELDNYVTRNQSNSQ